MFIVEPGEGNTEEYPSARELFAAIQRGDLGPQARIYHRSTAQWLPITVHPEYRKVAAERERVSVLELQARQWTFLPDVRPQYAAYDEGQGASSSPPLMLIPGDPEPSWLGATFRRLRKLARF
jgi:hypothetical protein